MTTQEKIDFILAKKNEGSPMAYKPTDEIRSLIEPTVEVLDVIKPVINLKAK